MKGKRETIEFWLDVGLAALAFVMGCAATACFGQVQGESRYEPHEPICLDVQAEAPEGTRINAIWRIEGAEFRSKGATEVFVWAKPGKYQARAMVWTTRTVNVDGVEGELLVGPPREFYHRFEVAGKQTPDEPEPEPDEPEPQSESPFRGEGLRVLIVYETDDLLRYDKRQNALLYSRELRTWANENCAKNEGLAEFRVYDKDMEASGQWADALQRPRSELPWILVGNGTTGFEGPLPATTEATIALLERYR